MSDNLTIFGTDYTGVTGIKAKSTGNGTLIYVRPTGTKSITENGTAIDVTQYANVDVDVSTGPDWPTFTTNDEGTAITCDKTYAECRALIQDGVTGAFAQFGSFSTVLIALWVNAANEDLHYIYVDNGVPVSQLNYASDGTITTQDSADSVTTLDVIQNGTYSDGLWNEVEVNVPAPAPKLQSKTAIPTEQQQIVLPDSDYHYDGLSSVTVNAIPSTYVGSSITQHSSNDLTVSEATVTVPAGYYSAQASKAVASGTAGTPTAAKGTVSNHAISVTPSVTNTTGYITGGTKTGTAVKVSVSELVNGTYTVDSSGTKDVTNYASASVASGSATASATKGSVSNHSITVTPSVTRTAGWVTAGSSNGTVVTVSASELVSGTKSITENGTTDVTNYTSVNVAVPTSGETLTITLALSNGEWVPNKTYAEVKAAYDAGNTIVISAIGGDGMACSTSIAFYANYFLVKVAWFDFVDTGLWYDDAYNLKESGWTLYERNIYQPPLKLIEKTITANGTYNPTIADFADGYSLVTVNVPSGTDNSSSMNDPIRFFDYDGTLVASYKSVPSTLPTVPTHTKLTNGTWNYTLAQITSQFNAMGACDIGANYDTASGKNEIDVTLNSDHLEPWLCVAVNGTATVDWGDGSEINTITGTSFETLVYTQHTYSQAGNYTISIDGPIGFFSESSCPSILRPTGDTSGNRRQNHLYCDCITAIRVADGSYIGNYAFYSCYTLTSVSIPASITYIGNYAFSNCYELVNVTIPSGVTSTDIGTNTFAQCHNLTSVSISPNVTSMGASTFIGCSAIETIVLPEGIEIINSQTFQGCPNLHSIILPNNATNIGTQTFSNCSGLTNITIPSNFTSVPSSAFNNCYTLTSVTIPSSVTSINSNAFNGCYSLTNVTIPSSVTNIGSSAFQSCLSLMSITIPANVTDIGSNAFNGDYGTYEYHLKPTTPPTLGTNAFSGIQSGTVIYVPAGSLTAYQSATKWSTYASYMVGE